MKAAASGASDTEIVRAVVDGDRDAYAVLVSRYEARVQRMLRWMCGNAYDAEELCQEAFFRAYFALPSHDPACRFSTWLFQIAHNLAVTFVRRRDRDLRLDEHDDDEASRDPNAGEIADDAPQPADLAERSDVRRRLADAVAALPEDFRSIILLRHVAEMSYDEICAATGLPMGTVKSRLARARERLAQAIREDDRP